MGIIADRITKARKELGLNQKELAKKASLTEANLSRYENGIREPKSAVLARLADALEVSTDYLAGLTDEKTYDSYDLSKKNEDDIKKYQEINTKLKAAEMTAGSLGAYTAAAGLGVAGFPAAGALLKLPLYD